MFVTTTFYGSRGTLRSNILKQVFKHINFFGSIVNFPRQHRKIIFRVDKTAKNVWRKKLRNILFQEKKTYYFNFFKTLHEFFLPLAKTYRHGCQNCNLSTFRKFWRKLDFFFEMEHVCKHLRTSRWKNRALVKNFSSGFLQQDFALPEKGFEEKGLVFRESFFFCYHFWSLSDFFVFLQNCLVRCAKPPIIVHRKINGKIYLEILFSSNNFGIEQKKHGLSAKQ